MVREWPDVLTEFKLLATTTAHRLREEHSRDCGLKCIIAALGI